MPQKNIVTLAGLGFDGQPAVLNNNMSYKAENFVSDGTVKAGTFAFAKSEGICAGTGTVCLGFVERVADVTLNINQDGTNIYPAGAVVTVAVEGAYYVTANGTVSTGYLVLVDGTTGAISFAAETDEDLIDTGFKVVVPNGKASAGNGDIIIIERY